MARRPSWPDRFLTELPKYGAIAPTAKAVKVGRSTVYAEFERNPDFKDDVDRILSACVEEVEGALFKAATDPDKTVDRIFYLKTRKPEVYGDKLRQDQVEQIRAQARDEFRREVERQVLMLPEGPRKLVLEALAKARKELPA